MAAFDIFKKGSINHAYQVVDKLTVRQGSEPRNTMKIADLIDKQLQDLNKCRIPPLPPSIPTKDIAL